MKKNTFLVSFKLIFLFAFSILGISQLSAQTPQWVSDNLSTVSGDTQAVTTDASGNVYVASKYLVDGQLHVAKLNSAGAVLWSDVLEDNENTNVRGLEIVTRSGTDYLYVAFDSQTTTSGVQTLGIYNYNASTGARVAGKEYVHTGVSHELNHFTISQLSEETLILVARDIILKIDLDLAIISQWQNGTDPAIPFSINDILSLSNTSPDVSSTVVKTNTDMPFFTGSPLANTQAPTDATNYALPTPEIPITFGVTKDSYDEIIDIVNISSPFTVGTNFVYRSAVEASDGALCVYFTAQFSGDDYHGVVRLNAADNYVLDWSRQWRTGYNDPGGIVADGDSHIYVYSWEGIYNLRNSALDIQAIKFDIATGLTLWSKTYGASTNNANEVLWSATAVDIDRANQEIVMALYTDSYNDGTPSSLLLSSNYDGDIQNYTIMAEAGVAYVPISVALDGNRNAYVGIRDYSGGPHRVFKVNTTTVFLGPSLSSSTPIDDTTGVATNSNIVLTFTDNIAFGTGNIQVIDLTDGSNSFTIDAASPGTQASITNNVLTINPSSDLDESSNYAIQIAATAIDDTSSRDFEGITDNTTLNFTTADETNPAISSVGLASSNEFIDVTFSEGVFDTGLGSGAVETGDFDLSITGGSATSPTVTSVTNSGDTGLTGGETTIRVNFSVTGTPNGSETLAVDITDGSSIFDAAGNPAVANQTSNNTASLNDVTAPSGYSVTIDQSPINIGNEGSVSFTFASAEVGATYNYTFTSSSGGTPITGSGTIATAEDEITGIDLSGLVDGTITLSAILTDVNGNTGSAATDTETKNTEVSASVNDPSITEGDSGTTTLTFTVSLSQGAPAGGATIDYAVTAETAAAGTDFTLIGVTTLSFSAGETNKTVDIDVVGDEVLEVDETVTITLTNPTGTNVVIGDATGTGTIINDDAAAVTIADAIGNENDGSITVTATLDNPVQGGFTVDVSTSNGTATTADSDYSSVISQTLTFTGNASETQTFTVTPTGDTKLEGNETITISQSNLAGTTLAVNITDGATVTINNDDAAAVTIADAIGNENDGSITVTATLDNAVQGGFTVDVSTSNGTATTADSDYSSVISQTLTFTGNASETQTFTVTPTGDTKLEGNETITISQSNLASTTLAVNITDGATVTINNDDAAAVTIADVTGNEDNGAITVTATLDNAVQGGFTVDVNTTDGTATTADSDYSSVTSQTLTFIGSAGEMQTFTVTPTSDTTVETDEQLTVFLNNLASTGLPVDITDGATIEIINDDNLLITNEVVEVNVSIYPNPVKNELHINTNNLKIDEVSLFDVLGKSVKSFKYNNQPLDFSRINSGIYILKIKTNKGINFRRIIKR